MEIENLDERFQIQDKRFKAPSIVKSKCPKCGDAVVKDIRKDYIGYPLVNEEFEMYFYHECADDGDHEWTENVVLRVQIEAAMPGEDL